MLNSDIKNYNHHNSEEFSQYHVSDSGLAISYSSLLENLIVCINLTHNGSQNVIRIYNTGDENLLINIGFNRTDISFTPSKNNFSLENSTNELISFTFNVSYLETTAIGIINITGRASAQPGNPIVASALINIMFILEGTRRLNFIVKNINTNNIIPDITVKLYRKMDSNDFLEYSSQYCSTGSNFFLIPNGTYRLEVYQNGIEIGEETITITSEDEVTIVIYCDIEESPGEDEEDGDLESEDNLILIIILLVIILASISVVVLYYKVKKAKKQTLNGNEIENIKKSNSEGDLKR